MTEIQTKLDKVNVALEEFVDYVPHTDCARIRLFTASGGGCEDCSRYYSLHDSKRDLEKALSYGKV